MIVRQLTFTLRKTEQQHPRIAGHGPTLYQSGLPSTRRLEMVSAKPLRNGAVAMHYRRVHG